MLDTTQESEQHKNQHTSVFVISKEVRVQENDYQNGQKKFLEVRHFWEGGKDNRESKGGCRTEKIDHHVDWMNKLFIFAFPS